MSVASRAILSNFFEEQGAQNYPQYLSGLSRALFPTTFLKIPVSEMHKEVHLFLYFTWFPVLLAILFHTEF